MRILAGDIGGTNTRLAELLWTGGARAELVREARFPSREFKGLDEIVVRFVESSAQISSACFGIAGVIQHGVCRTTNLPWIVDAALLARELQIPSVQLINDLEANAYGIDWLGPNDFETLQEGEAGASGNAAIIAAGTGLGQAGLFWDGTQHRPFASEGGHTDFAPTEELHFALWRFLSRRHGKHVSWERVLSGPGLVSVYEFLAEKEGKTLKPFESAAEIAEAGLSGRDELCEQALELFAYLYGAEAGNLAMKLMPLGGLYVGGGIAPKIIVKLRQRFFIEGFLAKGRMRGLLERIPIRVILNDRTGLLGAARLALLKAKTDAGI